MFLAKGPNGPDALCDYYNYSYGPAVQGGLKAIRGLGRGKQCSKKQCSRAVHMHISIKTMVGGTISLAITALDTVGMVKMKIYDSVGIPLGQQRLLLAGKPVVDYFTMLDYDIQHKTTLQVAWRSCGGMHTVSSATSNSGNPIPGVDRARAPDVQLAHAAATAAREDTEAPFVDPVHTLDVPDL